MTKVDIASLYHNIIIDHAKSPDNYGKLDTYTHFYEGHNALCGDKIIVYLKVEDSKIKEMKFESAACAICNASSSMLSDRVKDISIKEWESILSYFRRFIASPQNPLSFNNRLGKSFLAFKALEDFPARKKCALLPWETLEYALSEKVN